MTNGRLEAAVFHLAWRRPYQESRRGLLIRGAAEGEISHNRSGHRSLAFLRECTAARSRRNIAQIVTLGLYSHATLQALRAETGNAYDHLSRGILHFYASRAELDAAIEPALASCRKLLAGGSMTTADESGDAHMFTQRLAALAAARGVKFLNEARILALERKGDRISGVRVECQVLKADAYVVSLGAHSPLLTRRSTSSSTSIPRRAIRPPCR